MKLPTLMWAPTHSLMWIVLGKRNPRGVEACNSSGDLCHFRL